MLKKVMLLTAALFPLASFAPAHAQQKASPAAQVRAAETAFAKSMADRDLAALRYFSMPISEYR